MTLIERNNNIKSLNTAADIININSDSQIEITAHKKKIENLERVMKEMKKQLVCYKDEIQGIKKMESYLTLENY